jgi:two-component system NtrC family sensor kinase
MKTLLYKAWLFIIFIVYSFTASAQSDSLYIDSLKKVLQTQREDTNKVNTYFDVGYFYQWSQPDSALRYAIPGLELAKKLNFISGEYDMILPITEALSLKGNYSKALELRLYSIELAKQLKNPTKIANALALTGNIYQYSKDYQSALKYLYKAQSTNAVTLGGPKVLIGMIGEAYFYIHNFDSAFVYIQKAYDLDLKDTYHWRTPYQFLAAIYEQRGNFSKAIQLYKHSSTISDVNDNNLNDYNGLASVYNKTGQRDSAIFYAKKVIREGKAVSITEPIIEASTLLANIYKSMHETDSALTYLEILLATKDSLFSQDKVRQMQNVTYNEQLRQQEEVEQQQKLQSKIKLYVVIAALLVFLIIAFFLYRNNRHKQKANVLLQHQKEKVESTLSELKSTQQQLIQSEKMASLGELTAGIAHEIQNPLNFVNNFSDVNKELLEELKEEADKGNIDEVKAIATDVIDNSEKINHHGKRADAIVKGMLQHSRASTGKKEPTDINALADEYLRLSYHGMRAKDKNFNATLETNFDNTIGKINVVPQDIGRVLLNLFNNAFYATNEKQKTANKDYQPTVFVETKKTNNKIEIVISDNGNGIPQNIVDKIFQPFFTTKPTGQGTGLGLSLSYDIIKAHGGEIRVETKEGEGTTFIIQLPV